MGQQHYNEYSTECLAARSLSRGLLFSGMGTQLEGNPYSLKHQDVGYITRNVSYYSLHTPNSLAFPATFVDQCHLTNTFSWASEAPLFPPI